MGTFTFETLCTFCTYILYYYIEVILGSNKLSLCITVFRHVKDQAINREKILIDNK